MQRVAYPTPIRQAKDVDDNPQPTSNQVVTPRPYQPITSPAFTNTTKFEATIQGFQLALQSHP
jgi:hypothetical protein